MLCLSDRASKFPLLLLRDSSYCNETLARCFPSLRASVASSLARPLANIETTASGRKDGRSQASTSKL